jgi:2-polyprenyl-3-methyl-5-hydroxy-6-metoxy-1,4-benzoquinol methylase
MPISPRYQAIMDSLEHYTPSSGFSNLKILDVGDYYPDLPVYLAKKGGTVSVLDFDCQVDTQKIYFGFNIKFYSCDLNEVKDVPIPVEDQFDIIIWLEVIEHLKCSPKYIFKEFSRLLKPGGLLVLGTPNAGRLSSRLRCLMGRHPYNPSLEPFYFGAEKFVGHRREYFIQEIDMMLNWNAYDILDRIHFNGTISDHKKKGLLRSAAYLALTFFFKHFRWLYIVIAPNTGGRPFEPTSVKNKRV